MPFARYFKFDGQRWKAVPYEEMSARYNGCLRYGVLELLAHEATLDYMDGDRAVHRHIIGPPLVSQSANSSCTLKALEDSLPQFNLGGIQDTVS